MKEELLNSILETIKGKESNTVLIDVLYDDLENDSVIMMTKDDKTSTISIFDGEKTYVFTEEDLVKLVEENSQNN